MQQDQTEVEESMRQLLADNLGSFVTIEFLVGADAMVTHKGVLYAVGEQYVVLYDEPGHAFLAGDLEAIRFVTFYMNGQWV